MDRKKSNRGSNARWVVKLFTFTLAVSIVLSYASTKAMEGIAYPLAFLLLFVFVAIGVVFDIVGVAVTSADVGPFNAMASRKVRGSKEALRLIKNVDRVSAVCSDVIGDISGIFSGSTGAFIAAMMQGGTEGGGIIISLLITGFVSAIMVGGKAAGKTIAINNSTEIVHAAGIVVYYVRKLMRRRS